MTPKAQQLAQARESEAVAAQKATYAERLRRIQQHTRPPLRNSELSQALGHPVQGQGASPVARWTSTSPRWRRARPDTASRTIIDLILEGALFLAVESLPGTARRNVVLCTEHDLPRIGPSYDLYNLAGREVDRPCDWEDETAWDLFGAPSPTLESAAIQREASPLVDAPWLPLPSLGLGCMRLSTPGRPPRAQALQVLRDALDAGIRLLDTADVYALDDEDLHHNHELIRAVGPHPEVLIATKGGLGRPGGQWRPRGRPEQLIESARRSREALGRIDLWQLHTPDPSVPWDEQLDATRRILELGIADHIGLCNVTEAQLDQALLARLPLSAVQLGVSLLEPRHLRSGLVRRCQSLGIQVLAHSPLGGHRRRGVLRQRMRPDALSAEQRALRWLLCQGVTPLVGATRTDSLLDSMGALTPADWVFDPTPFRWQAEVPAVPTEVRIVMGPPAAGKTRLVLPLEQRGWARFNRDREGGSLAGLAQKLDGELAESGGPAVLDNTYADAEARGLVVQTARRHGAVATCVRVDVSERRACLHACFRMLERHGRILSPDEINASRDPNMLPPGAIRAWFRRHTMPTPDEGFLWVRTYRPPLRVGDRAALIFDLDGTLRRSRGSAPFPTAPAEVELLPGRRELLQALHAQGWLLLGATNQAGIARGQLTHAAAEACIQQTVALLGVPMDVRMSPWADGRAWERKPLPGMGAALIRDHGLDPGRCLVVGDQDSDRAFAEGLGMAFADADAFFQHPEQHLPDPPKPH